MRKIIFFIFLFIIGIFVFKGISFWQQIHNTSHGNGDKIVFEITSGSSMAQMATVLKEMGMIDDEKAFVNYVKFRRYDRFIKAGVYELPNNLSIISLVRELQIGPNQEEITLTFLEGWTTQEMQEYLVKEKVITQGAFVEAIHEILSDESLEERYSFITDQTKETKLEGFLFPDTYRFFKGVQAKEIVIKMLDTFEKKMNKDLLQAIQNSDFSLYEIVTIASILEQEVQSKEDKGLVADIIYKRLEDGMPLQMDSTVNYITGRNRDRIYYVDRDIDSPYNTYKYRGLPLGPIANPGIDSILAAIFPESNAYYYFLTDSSGIVYYAKTLEGHANNRQYLD